MVKRRSQAVKAAGAPADEVVPPADPIHIDYPDTVDGIEEEALDDDDIFPVPPKKKPTFAKPADPILKTVESDSSKTVTTGGAAKSGETNEAAVAKTGETDGAAAAKSGETEGAGAAVKTGEIDGAAAKSGEIDGAAAKSAETEGAAAKSGETDGATAAKTGDTDGAGPAPSPRKVIDVIDDLSGPDAVGNPPIPGLHTDEPEEELVEYWVPTRYEVEDAVGPDYIPYVFDLPRVEPPEFIFSVGEIAKKLLPELKNKHSLSKRKHREVFCISCLDFKLKSGECSRPHDEHNDDRFQEFWLKEYPHTDALTKQGVMADLEHIAEIWQ